jgi:hypothetical protein
MTSPSGGVFFCLEIIVNNDEILQNLVARMRVAQLVTDPEVVPAMVQVLDDIAHSLVENWHQIPEHSPFRVKVEISVPVDPDDHDDDDQPVKLHIVH